MVNIRAAIALFIAVKNNKKVKGLDITFSDNACDVITVTLERNGCLVRLVTLHIFNNPLSGEAIVNIIH